MDIPDYGAVFVFGKCNAAQNQLNHFFIKNDPVVCIQSGNNFAAAICESGALYTFGQNTFGQLGLGNFQNTNRPTIVKTLKNEQVVQVACGDSHMIILTNKGIYGCGNNKFGQLGIESTNEKFNTPKLISKPEIVALINNRKLKEIKTGRNHSVLLTADGNIFVWGSNFEGQIGLGIQTSQCTIPTSVEIPDEFICGISCGFFHTILVSKSGTVLSFGENINGKIGKVAANEKHIWNPQKILQLSKVDKIYSGASHNFIITADGNLFAFGSNLSGQLGFGKSVFWTDSVIEIKTNVFQDEKITKISCGETHTIFMTETGKIFVCGESSFGKLCMENEMDEDIVYLPKLVKKFANYKVMDVACGNSHTLIKAVKIPSMLRNRNRFENKFQKPHIPIPDFDGHILFLDN